MKKPLCAIALLLAVTGASAADGVITKSSNNSVTTTLDKLEALVKEKGFTVFARVNHAAGAKRVGETLRPTELLVFGNPKVGTALLLKGQGVALDLPIRVASWEDAQGRVWLAYNDPAWLVRRYDIAGADAVVAKMTTALANLTDAAARE